LLFAQGWPIEDAVVVADQQLEGYVADTGDRLQEVIKRLWRRLQWAREQLSRLGEIRNEQGTLKPDQDALWGRCDRFIKKLKGLAPRRRREAEGVDETNTFGVLASEGFLPGYGLEVGAVTGFFLVPRSQLGLSDFDLPRVSSVAVREYVPGNLIYANGNRFLPRYYHLDPQGVQDQVRLQVDIENQTVAEFGGNAEAAGPGLGAQAIRGVPICDLDLPHQSHITDEEDYRFQLAVSVFGKAQDRHGEGKAFHWGSKQVSLRRSVHLRLVNVGPASKVQRGELGYPVCSVCGQSRSPLASQADLDNFRQEHAERCHQNVEPTCFYADIVADALTLHVCSDREEAYSVGESLRMGASRVLDMEIDDLQLVCIARAGSEEVDLLLYDPMPGGSGLLDQVLTHWAEVVAEAKDLVEHCPSACASSCIDCLQTFRNAFYHRYLNRVEALRCFQDWGDALQFSHDIPPKQAAAGAEPTGRPGHEKEQQLRDMLLRAGFIAPVMNREIDLGRPHPKTYPDVFFEVPDGRKEGVCVYLDGMSGHLHGNPQTAQRDRQIRELLRNENYEVIEIPVGNLDDREAMRRHFYRIGAVLLGKEQAVRIRDNPDWHSGQPSQASASGAATPGKVQADCAVFTVRFAKPGDAAFSPAEKRLCTREAQQGLMRVLSDITHGSGLTVEVRLAGEGDGSFWVEFLAAVGVVVSFTGGIGNACQIVGAALQKWGASYTPEPVVPLQQTGKWLQGVAYRLVAQPPTSPDASELRPGCHGKGKWLDLRTSRCKPCGFLANCKQVVKGNE